MIGVGNVVESMSSLRLYRPALGTDKALEEISQNKGILYDPEGVDVYKISIFRKCKLQTSKYQYKLKFLINIDKVIIKT